MIKCFVKDRHYLCPTIYHFTMQFKKGQKKTPGSGRKAGTPNKSTRIGIETIQTFLAVYEESGMFSEDWNRLKPKDRLNLAVKMMNYIIPKCTAITEEDTTSVNHRKINDILIELSRE